MQLDPARIEEIFASALAKPDAPARAAYLDEACGADAELRQRIDALLAAHGAEANFLNLPDTNFHESALLSEGPGSKIGRYKLLEQIGEGGFGVVFMAEQEEPVHRRVALKIIKLGMDTKQVVARFEAERQALAMMDHPNIAKVLDGGSTDMGRPYFVMELVKGIPITTFCDQLKLTTTDRLNLFILVCAAVQHAHQKGIIHRDLKPTNVLVTMHDDKPVPKVIDFGIAKATQARLTEKTLFTEFRQLVGTPTYMSPEQAQMNGLDIDTRSDVYSLGVLLYELLAGSTPFTIKQLMSSGFEEMQRIIREVEPPPPSTRLADSHDSLLSISAQRQSEPTKLTKLMRGDLDWIVMRCLEKDRTRRYGTAADLAHDVQRYLTDQPVEARRPTYSYRFKKFVSRNKFGVLAGSAVAVALAAGLLLASIGFIQARRQAEATDKVNQYLRQMLGEADVKHSDNIATAWLLENLAELAKGRRDYEPAVHYELQSLEILKKFFPPDHGLVEGGREKLYLILSSATSDRVLSTVCNTAEELAKIESIFWETTEPELQEFNDHQFHQPNAGIRDLPQFPLLYRKLADELAAAGNIVEAEKCRQKADRMFDDLEAKFAGHAPELGGIYCSHIRAFVQEDKREQAERECSRLFAVITPNTATINNVAWSLTMDREHQCAPAVAIKLAEKAVQIAPENADHWNTLGAARYRAGQWQAAIDALNKSEEFHQPDPAFDWFFLAMAHWQLGHQAEARQWFDKAVQSMDVRQPKDPELQQFRNEATELLKVPDPASKP